jgi:hypothetical protein
LKVGEVQNQLGQHCCDVGSFEDMTDRVGGRVLLDNSSIDDLARGFDRVPMSSRALRLSRLIKRIVGMAV